MILKPDFANVTGPFITVLQAIGTIEHSDFRILSPETVAMLYPEHVGEWYWERHLEFMTSGPSWIVGMEVPDMDALNALKTIIRAGTDNPRNRIHVSDDAERDIELFWESLCLTTH